MNTLTVLSNLALFVPLTTVLWILILPRSGPRLLPVLFWIVLQAISVVALGGFLAAMVALSFNEVLLFAPFAWMEQPVMTVKVILSCGAVGGLFSFGLAKALGGMLRAKIAAWKPSLQIKN